MVVLWGVILGGVGLFWVCQVALNPIAAQGLRRERYGSRLASVCEGALSGAEDQQGISKTLYELLSHNRTS